MNILPKALLGCQIYVQETIKLLWFQADSVCEIATK